MEKKKLSEAEIERNVNYVTATMAFEGMFLTEEEIEALKEIRRGNMKEEDYIKQIKREYMVNG